MKLITTESAHACRYSFWKFAGAVSGGVALLLSADIASASHACTVNFDNSSSLAKIYGSARDTFANSTGTNSAGQPVFCGDPTNASAEWCWQYQERCSGYIQSVDDISGYGHYHLGMTNAGFFTTCSLADPGDGYGYGFLKLVGGSCVFPNWNTEPRNMYSHDATQWIAITLKLWGLVPGHQFNFTRIRVSGAIPIQLWYRVAATQQWFHWASLAANTNWNLPGASAVDQVKISGAAGQIGPYTIEDFDLTEL